MRYINKVKRKWKGEKINTVVHCMRSRQSILFLDHIMEWAHRQMAQKERERSEAIRFLLYIALIVVLSQIEI